MLISLTFLSWRNCSDRDSIDIVLLCSFRYQYSSVLNFPVLLKWEILLKLTVVYIIVYYITIIIIVTVPLVIRSQHDTSRSLCSWSRSSVMLCISWVFYLSFPSGAVWDDICYVMPVHFKLLNVPLLSHYRWRIIGRILQHICFRRSATNKPAPSPPPGDTHSCAFNWDLLTVLRVVVRLRVSNQHVGDRELEETNCWMGFQNRRSGSMFLNGSLSFNPSASKWASCFAF